MNDNLIEKFDDDGKQVSPSLPVGIKNYLIDIDGTISEDVPNETPLRMLTCKEIPGAKERINQWYEYGHVITFFTSRLEEHRAYTEQWLKERGFKYHQIIFGKPRGGNYHWIDDKEIAVTLFKGSFEEII
jgi:hypothetical protein